jgi:hypothetical protein
MTATSSIGVRLVFVPVRIEAGERSAEPPRAIISEYAVGFVGSSTLRLLTHNSGDGGPFGFGATHRPSREILLRNYLAIIAVFLLSSLGFEISELHLDRAPHSPDFIADLIALLS